jgi:hypothetical protein
LLCAGPRTHARTRPRAGCAATGDGLLEAMGFLGTNVWRLIGWLVLESVVLRVLAFLALHFLWTGQSMKDRLRALC